MLSGRPCRDDESKGEGCQRRDVLGIGNPDVFLISVMLAGYADQQRVKRVLMCFSKDKIESDVWSHEYMRRSFDILTLHSARRTVSSTEQVCLGNVFLSCMSDEI